MYVLYKNGDNYILTPKENYEARISNARKYTVFKQSNGFCSLQEVTSFIQERLKIDLADVEVIE